MACVRYNGTDRFSVKDRIDLTGNNIDMIDDCLVFFNIIKYRILLLRVHKEKKLNTIHLLLYEKQLSMQSLTEITSLIHPVYILAFLMIELRLKILEGFTILT